MSKKDVIYIDVEDDITTIIDKATGSKSDIVALVLPKRATVLQSIVNMKLLKKAADDANKKMVLITSENSLLPLAGSTGLHVAESLQSRPHLPEPIAAVDQEDTLIEDEPDLDPQEPIGDLAEGSGAAATGKAGKVTKKARKSLGLKKTGSKLKIPNFSSFRNRMILGSVLLVLLIAGWVFGFIILPKATVSIQAQTTPLPTDVKFQLDPDAENSDLEKRVLAVRREEIIKTVANEFTATGEKDVGEKATGTMTVQNCDSSTSITVPAGTVFTDTTTGYSFTTDEAVLVPGGTFSSQECTEAGEADVPVTAAESGDSRNLDPRSYVTDFSEYVTGFGGQMSGGTTEIIKVVSQEDIKKARSGIQPADEEEMLSQLRQQFGDDVIMIAETFNAKKGEVNHTPVAGTEANQGRVTAQYTYTAFGVEKDVLAQLLKAAQEEKIDAEQQVVLDTGIEEVALSLIEAETGAGNTNLISVAAETEGYAGPDFDTGKIAQEIEGMRYSEVIQTIKAKPGVSQVEVDFSPFWVFSAPKASHTTVNIEVSEQTLQ